MRRTSSKLPLAVAGLVIASVVGLGASEAAAAKRIKIGARSGYHAAPVPRPGSGSEQPADNAAATAAPIDTKEQEAERAAVFERAKQKLADERALEIGTAGAQVNTSASSDGVVCLAGCYK